MTRRHFRDNAPAAPLAADINSSTGSCTVEDGTLVGMPTSTPWPGTIDRGTATAEQIEVTGVVGNVVSMTRNANGLGAFSHVAGAKLEHTANAVEFDEANAHVNSISGVHGIQGDVVGTTDEQTLSHKTLEGAKFEAVGGVPGLAVTAMAPTDTAWEITDDASVLLAKVDGAGNLTAGDVAAKAVSVASLGTTGDATVGGTATVTGEVTAGGFVHANAGVGVAGGLTVNGGATINGGMGVAGGTTTVAALHATGAATLDSTLSAKATTVTTLSTSSTLTSAGDVKSHGVVVPLGIIARVTADSDGTQLPTDGAETRDAVLGNLVFTSLAGRRYRVVLSGRGMTSTSIGDRYGILVRDGGGSTPSSADPQWGNYNIVQATEENEAGTGVAQQSFYFATTDKPSAGVHTLGLFITRVAGSGQGRPTGSCEFYVEDIGAV